MKIDKVFLVKIIILWVLIISVIGDRFILKFETGGKGIFPFHFIITLGLTGIIVLKSPLLISAIFRNIKFVIFWSPYLLLTFLLPMVGILVMDYPIRTLLSSLIPLINFSYIILGYFVGMSVSHEHRNIIWRKVFLFAVLLQFLYSFSQYLFRLELLPEFIWSPFHTWDLLSQEIYRSQIIYGRSIGLYINPNILGFWAVIAFFGSLIFFKSRYRIIGAIASSLTLILSQSRGAITACLIGILVIIFAYYKQYANIIISVFMLLLAIFFGFYIFIPDLIEDAFLERMSSFFDVLTKGIEYDQNLRGRTIFWAAAIDYWIEHPLGSLGPPEFKLGTAIDNDWIRLLMQGGIIYVLSFFMMLIGGFYKLNKKLKEGQFIFIISIAIFVTTLSQTSLTYSPMSIYWFFLGICLYHSKNFKI